MICTTRQGRREMSRHLKKENARFPDYLICISRDKWPIEMENARADKLPINVLRSKRFLVQVFRATDPALVRISICRTEIDGDRWKEGISWEDLQRIKDEAGYADYDAVEIYPVAEDVVNVANMRHLWVMKEKLSFKWSNG